MPHYAALLCYRPVSSLTELAVLSPFIDSETLTDEIQNHRTRTQATPFSNILRIQSTLSSDLESMTFVSKNFLVEASRPHDFNYTSKLFFNFLVNQFNYLYSRCVSNYGLISKINLESYERHVLN